MIDVGKFLNIETGTETEIMEFMLVAVPLKEVPGFWSKYLENVGSHFLPWADCVGTPVLISMCRPINIICYVGKYQLNDK
jgi:hypothetical protein